MTLYQESDVTTSNVNRGLRDRLAIELGEMREQGVYKQLQHIMGAQSAVVIASMLR